ncbi:MAG TPA: preprotein translocase subunit SecG [Candidatus Latescibacteria bacterium]|nr:preprotein translocase subunit SecG [Candidatus Latescibacterota bacterium]
MSIILILVHVFVAFALVMAILLQSGRGGGLAGAFGGGGGAGTIFGGRGAAPFLSKVTAALAIVFALTSVALNITLPRGDSKMKSQALESLEKKARERSPAAALPGFPVEEEPVDSLQ